MKQQRAATIRDLATELDIHHTTVSRALGGHPKISEETRRRVLALAQKRHYQPNQLARSLRIRTTSTLGVLFPYATLPYYATLLDALDAEADERGLQLRVHFHQWSISQEVEAMQSLLEQRVRGVLICPASASSVQTLAKVIPSSGGVPVIFLTSSFFEKEMPAFVTARIAADLRLGAEMLGRHLVERGHRHLAMLGLTSPATEPAIDVRVEGLRKALRKVPGASLSVISVPLEHDEGAKEGELPSKGVSARKSLATAEVLAEHFLREAPRPTAVVTKDETSAYVLLTQLQKAGIRVPEDVSVACFGGTYLSEFGLLPLTCIEQPFAKMAQVALEVLTANMEGSKQTKPIVRLLSPALVSRASVAWRHTTQ